MKHHSYHLSPEDTRDVNDIFSFFQRHRKDGKHDINTKDASFAWKLLGVKPRGHELVGVKRLPVSSLCKLTGEIVHRNASEVDNTIMRVYRMLTRKLDEDENGRDVIDPDTFWIFLKKSCGISDLSKSEATNLLNQISRREGVLDVDSFFTFMTKKLSVEEIKDDEENEEEKEEDIAERESNRLLSHLSSSSAL
jgi:hypothetical protein